MNPEVEPLCCGWMLWKMTLIRPMPYTCMSITHIDRTYSHHWRQQSTIPLSSRLFRHTRVAMLGSVAVQVVAWPDGSQWSLVTEQVQRVPRFLPWMLFGQPSLIALILTCICTTRPFRTWSTGEGTFHIPLMKTAKHQHIVPNMCSSQSIFQSSFLQAYNAILFK